MAFSVRSTHVLEQAISDYQTTREIIAFFNAPVIPGSGTVTSVGVTGPVEIVVTNSPVISSGNIALAWSSRLPNTVFAGPTSGGSSTPSFRALVANDIPVITEAQVSGLTSDLSLKAPLNSPVFTGTPTAPTPTVSDSSTKLATTAWVNSQGYGTGAVTSVFGRGGAVAAQIGDYAVGQVTGAAPIDSPSFTGTPLAPTQLIGDNSTAIATTAWVKDQSYISVDAVPTVFGRTGAITAQVGDYSVAQVTGAAPLASPSFTGTPLAPTPLTADNSTKIATTAWVNLQGFGAGSVTSVYGRTGVVVATTGDYTVAQVTGAAPLASPTFTGTPAGPTPLTADSSTALATTAFVKAQNYLTANAVTTVFGRSGAVVATSGDYGVAQVTGAAPLASPTFTGTVSLSDGVGVSVGSSSGSKIGTATTQKIGFWNQAPVAQPSGNLLTALGTATGVGLVSSPTIAEADVTGLTTDLGLKAPLASPTFTGIPAAPTAATTDNSTQLATTAYVNALAKNAVSFGSSYRSGLNTFNYLPTDQGTLPVATITVGSVSGDIPSAQVIAAQSSGALDTKYFRLRGTTFSFPDSTFCEGAANVTANNKTGWWAIEFCHYGQKFQLNIKGGGGTTASSLRVWVNGLPCNSIIPQILHASPGTATSLPLIDFGTTDFRRVRVEVSKEYFGGLRIGANDSIMPADWPIGMKAVVLTDSFGDGNAGDGTLGLNHYNSYAHVMGAALDLDMWCSPCGGTGYLTTSATGGTFRSRVTTDVINLAPSVVFLAGGYNDRSGFTQAQLTTEIGLLVDAIQAGLPGVPIIIVGPWCPTTTASVGDPSLTNTRAAALAVATSYNLPFIDTFFWITSGNIAQMIQSFDNVHPAFQGHIYLGMKVAGWVEKLGLDMTGKASFSSPTFIGVPAAPTAALGTSTTQLATTAFVANSAARTLISANANNIATITLMGGF